MDLPIPQTSLRGTEPHLHLNHTFRTGFNQNATLCQYLACTKCGLAPYSHGVTIKTVQRGASSPIKFEFDPDSDNSDPYHILPNARVVLITFPIVKEGASERLVRIYARSHGQREDDRSKIKTRFIQLGTTTMWDGPRLQLTERTDAAPTTRPVEHKWYDRHSPFVPTPRAKAEDELLALSPEFPTTVLNLCGLWGGSRSPKNWVGKVAGSKEALKNKGSLHLIHGLDVARAVLAVYEDFDKAQGQRWLLSDGRIYDWWDLASAWSSSQKAMSEEAPVPIFTSSMAGQSHSQTPQATWVRELMEENDVRALPRDVQLLGRALDSRGFWKTFSLTPLKTLISH